MGRRYTGGSFVLLVGPTRRETGEARLGMTVSRKVGNAVVRNRLKRRVREWFRRGGRLLVPGLDVVVIARAGAAGLSGPAAFVELTRAARGVR